MRVGFVGAGTLTKTFGRHLINAGHAIVVSNSRGPETLTGPSPISAQAQRLVRRGKPLKAISSSSPRIG